jgi:hypothetical protein
MFQTDRSPGPDGMGLSWCMDSQVWLQAHLGNLVCEPSPLYCNTSLNYRRLYQVFYGLVVCPWYAYSQTMISEVSPGPQMCVQDLITLLYTHKLLGTVFRFLFFALFSVVGVQIQPRKASSKSWVSNSRLAKLQHLLALSSPVRLSLPPATMTTCRSRSCLDCRSCRSANNVLID